MIGKAIHRCFTFLRVAAAALIFLLFCSRQGSVEILAVDPARQGEGLGSHMLRRAEGILLNFRCR